ncbi:preprotein translocase subunit YajC [Parvularcula sp. LCG005]|uniref:preprotein translocase subunit YajC n=1 Tax=Parvularcula sp. LCG005 TaxID=3078805 RepID=UPI00294278CB|nr:preprotein translocase subunit YajC [Parvularcula sp. LCG005]WOI52002.1 preprotein translocase subunit YajC [Parvularcula sp. LCG005]
MFFSQAMAQTTDAAPGPSGLSTLIPFVLMFVVFYFLLIRPQQNARKKHMEMVKGVQRGDQVVTSGGILGKVVRASDGDEIVVEIAEGVQVTVVKQTLTDVRSRTQPAEKK